MKKDEQDEIESFIAGHYHRSLPELALILSKKDLPTQYILDQINGRRKAVHKFPFLSEKQSFVYPSPTSVSQASSEKAARYKAGIIPNYEKIVDLSGGMGIDAYFLSKKAVQLDYVEKNHELCELASRNFHLLSAENIEVHQEEAEQFLERSKLSYDLIYIDPDRRNKDKRLIKISDCQPNVNELLEKLFEKSDRLMIKFSPALDIQAGINDLKFAKQIHIVSIDNECKELLYILQKGFTGEPKRIAVDLSSTQQRSFEFYYSEERSISPEFGDLGEFLYEPNAAIMKSGAFNLITNRYKLSKLADNTHLYTSTEKVVDFPGRTLKVLETSTDAGKLCKEANIVSRNSGLSVEQIKKKYKIQEGGELFLYAYKNSDGKREFALCERR